MKTPTLLDYARTHAIAGIPRCFYCGRRAQSLDHSRAQRRLGTHHPNNLLPACKLCNNRKHTKSRADFRAYLLAIDRTWAKSTGRRPARSLKFYGEGARGLKLRHLRRLLTRITIRRGKLRAVAKGEAMHEHASEEHARRLERLPDRPRWLGRYTFTGSRALRAVQRATGCSAPSIERFFMGLRTTPENERTLSAACKRLALDVAALSTLKPREDSA